MIFKASHHLELMIFVLQILDSYFYFSYLFLLPLQFNLLLEQLNFLSLSEMLF